MNKLRIIGNFLVKNMLMYIKIIFFYAYSFPYCMAICQAVFSKVKHFFFGNLYIYFRCNFSMNPHVRLLVVLFVGSAVSRSVFHSFLKRKVILSPLLSRHKFKFSYFRCSASLLLTSSLTLSFCRKSIGPCRSMCLHLLSS